MDFWQMYFLWIVMVAIVSFIIFMLFNAYKNKIPSSEKVKKNWELMELAREKRNYVRAKQKIIECIKAGFDQYEEIVLLFSLTKESHSQLYDEFSEKGFNLKFSEHRLNTTIVVRYKKPTKPEQD